MSRISQFKGLALEGGGVAGLAYLGNYRRLLQIDPGMLYTHFAASSAGSFMAGFLAVRTTLDQMTSILRELDFKKIKDNSWFIGKDVYDLVRKYGWYNGDYLLEWYRNQMKAITGNPDITFLDVYKRYGTVLIITTTDVMKPFSRLIAMDYQSHPNHSVALAVRKSCSIPEVFEAVIGTGTDAGHIFVDGGVLLNYPIRLLYKYLAPEVCMGFYLTSESDNAGNDETILCTPVNGQIEFIESIADTWRNLAMKQYIDPNDWTRTCKTRITISATKFDLSEIEKKTLEDAGEVGMDEFLLALEKN
jgi:NTE family protein